MVWAKGNRPHQYLLSITENYQTDWEYLSRKAEDLEIPISELIRQVIRKQVEEWQNHNNSK